MSTNGSHHLPSEVELVALHYVSGDMDAATVEAFERRLATELEAQEALVAAMKLLAPDVKPPPRVRTAVRSWFRGSRFRKIRERSRHVHPAWWTIAGAAASRDGAPGV